ncbi:hypothetical protein J3E68DRAFT_444912 [Trichoderma sp. SZMC 28012]
MAKVVSNNTFGDYTNLYQSDIINISSYSGTGQLNLEYVPASFNDANKQHLSTCLPHTREQMLRDIRAWIDGDSEKGIYWLNGMAGTGKTTISLTIAHEYDQKKRLGASFFFSRGGGDLASVKKFAPTVAVQLAEQSPELRQLILKATTLNPRIGHLNIYNQWEKLVLEPLGSLESSSVQQPLLIVVDALDECDDEKDIGMLIECFVSTITNIKELPIRIFITSRPELPIHLTLGRVSINLRQHFTLHNIEQAIVDSDLRIFYQHHLAQLSQRYMWNQHTILDDAIRSLVGKTHGLFIYAATVCRFIKAGGRSSEKRLLVLTAPGPSASEAEKELDDIYTTVLESSFSTELSSREAFELQPEFQKIVGSVMVLFDTLALSDLVDVINGQKERVESMLNNLRSVLDISEDDRRQISILHPSFRDFLLNPGRCSHNLFRISAKQLHYDLFERCLAIMHSSLSKNICKLRSPAAKARDITKDQVDKCISFPIQYACRYWIQHLQRSERDWINHGGIKDFFFTDFLGWLEVLSLLGRLSEGINLLAGLHKSAATAVTNHASDTSTSQSLDMLIQDAKRFAFQHSGIIEETPLQIYCSALIFSPEQSLIRQCYHTEAPSWITPSFRRYDTWPRYTQALWHTQSPVSLAFSPDGSYLASGCEDGSIWLWNAVTGAKQRILVGHEKSIISIDFSLKEELIASGSIDGTIRLWNSTTGVTRGIFTHTCILGSRIRKVVFSPDGASLALLSSITMYWKNGVVDLFEWELGDIVFKSSGGYHPYIPALRDSVFSPNGYLLALCTDASLYGGTDEIHICDIRKRIIVHAFHTRKPLVAFSQDSRRIAFLSPSKKLCIFDFGTHGYVAQIEVDMGKLKFWSFDSNDRLVLFCAPKSSSPVEIQARDTQTELISRVIQLDHDGTLSHFKPIPAANIIVTKLGNRCEIWDLATGTVMGSFESARELAHSQLLPCKAHLRIDGAIVPLSKPDLLNCCSHRLSLEGLWIKRGSRKLVCIPPDYASALITLGRKGASFKPFKKSSRNIFRSYSDAINILEFDFSGIENYI